MDIFSARMADIQERNRAIGDDIAPVIAGAPFTAELRAGIRERTRELADMARALEVDARREGASDVAHKAAQIAYLASAHLPDAAREAQIVSVPTHRKA